MKKAIVSLLAAVMVLGSTMTVFAAPSATADDVAKIEIADLAVKAEDVKSSVGTVTVKAVEASSSAATGLQAAVVETLQKANTATGAAEAGYKAEVLAVADISISETIPAEGVAITIKDASIKAKDTIKVLHFDAAKGWEEVEVKADGVKAGEVTAIFKSLSPVAIVKVAAKDDNTGVGFSALSLIAAAGLVGTAVCGKKSK